MDAAAVLALVTPHLIASPNRRRWSAMVGRAFVGLRELEQARVGPHAAEQRDADRITAGHESGGHRDLWQPGRGALLAGAGLGPVAFEATLMRGRARLVRWIEHRVEPLAIHQVDEELPE